ncbi:MULTISPECIES: von Willebrand factor type A domain-containing protein [unclassified Acinetobacter]|uniref:vWA domain-containing protein n=1 Tax=unclassified Acinetobacter TaxID=196816 RepID=UPI0035B7ED38
MKKFQLSLITVGVLSLVACESVPHATNRSVSGVAVTEIQPVIVAPTSYQNSNMTKMVAPAPVMMAQESTVPVEDTEKYQNNEPNPIQQVSQNPVSTFSIDVDTGSYSNVRRYLNDGRLPPVQSVRLEEVLNYFDYQYAQPTGNQPFALHTTTFDSPWKKEAKLIKIAIQAKDIQSKELPPANLVFLVDVSGSMDDSNKLPLVKKTLRLLTEQLRPQDKVTIITYASGETLALEPTSGSEKDKILAVINSLQARGSTSGERAIRLAYEQAEKAKVKDGINRILIATDGDFNVGITDFDTLKGMVAEKRKSGISLTTLGFGTGNYNEKLMEQLADAGDGNYSYIDNENEAKKVLQRQLSSTLATVAQDVKIQVEFNPKTVKEYRLVGYENRVLKQEDFNNDKVDAGDVGAGHQVTAFYEIIPVGKNGWLDSSRYQTAKATENKGNEYGYLKLRYKLPNQSTSNLIETPLLMQSQAFEKADRDSKFAVATVAYAEQLRGGKYNGDMNWQNILDLAQNNIGNDPHGLRKEFVELVKIAQSLSSKAEKQ